MKLEWFRNHQGKFWVITAIFVIPTMAVFGIGRAGRSQGGVGRGPEGEFYDWEGSKHAVSPERLFEMRLELTRFGQRGFQYGSKEALHYMAAYRIARDLGLNVGNKELVEAIRDDVKRRTGKPDVTKARYAVLLDRMQMTNKQYRKLMRMSSVLGRYAQALEQVKIGDPTLYLIYCREKHRARILYQAFNSKDYESQAEKPTPERVKEYYESKKNLKPGERDALFTKPRLAADVYYVSRKDVEKRIEAPEAQLKKYYERYKRIYWRKEGKPGGKPPKGKEAYRPFAKVRDEVVKKFKRDQLSGEAKKIFKAFEKKLTEAEQKAAGPKAKPFDPAPLAQAQGLTYWRTKKLTRKAFLTGAAEVKAANFKLAWRLFRLAEPEEKAEEEKIKAQRRKALQMVYRVRAAKKDDGYTALRLAGYEPARRMRLEEASPLIVRRLIEEAAVKKARKAAEETRDHWVQGEGIPPYGQLEDETFDRNAGNALARQYFSQPKAIGKILDVAKDVDPEAAKKNPDSRRARFLVGFVVERTLPTWKAFEKDTTFNWDRRRKYLAQARESMLKSGGQEQLLKISDPKRTSVPDPPLFRGGPPPRAPRR